MQPVWLSDGGSLRPDALAPASSVRPCAPWPAPTRTSRDRHGLVHHQYSVAAEEPPDIRLASLRADPRPDARPSHRLTVSLHHGARLSLVSIATNRHPGSWPALPRRFDRTVEIPLPTQPNMGASARSWTNSCRPAANRSLNRTRVADGAAPVKIVRSQCRSPGWRRGRRDGHTDPHFRQYSPRRRGQ